MAARSGCERPCMPAGWAPAALARDPTKNQRVERRPGPGLQGLQENGTRCLSVTGGKENPPEGDTGVRRGYLGGWGCHRPGGVDGRARGGREQCCSGASPEVGDGETREERPRLQRRGAGDSWDPRDVAEHRDVFSAGAARHRHESKSFYTFHVVTNLFSN